jgi:hypothetical protein
MKLDFPATTAYKPAMLIDPKPIYRRVIVPWYDSEVASFATLLFAADVLFFGYLGIQAAYETPAYRQFLWIPGLLIVLGLTVILSIAVRWFLRHVQRSDR